MSVLRYSLPRIVRSRHIYRSPVYRQLHSSKSLNVVKPFLLADIGEGITECQLIQWFVQPGARVEQFDKLCEVQSDKASVEITSPFDGVIKKLHYEPDDMAITGKPLVDIDIQGEVSPADEAKLGGGNEENQNEASSDTLESSEQVAEHEIEAEGVKEEDTASYKEQQPPPPKQPQSQSNKASMGTLATPAVRHLTKELKVDIADVPGTGKDGRVLKEDVQRFVSERDQPAETSNPTTTANREDRKVPLSPVQSQMFKAMTRSLNIPHFLYSCSADMGAITSMRRKLQALANTDQKITNLAFIIKALSLSLLRHPLLNTSLNTKDPKKPELTYRSAHNFGIAIDSPAGLLVPVLRNVQDLSITEIAEKMRKLSEAARNNKLTPGDFSGATFTVSNIGSVGGGVVAPVISEPQVAILGIGRSRIVPAFDEHGELVKREELVFSWSADHRVVDGAECARCAERVKSLLEDPAMMLAELR